MVGVPSWLANLLNGKCIDSPPSRQVNATFKKAPKAMHVDAEPLHLFENASRRRFRKNRSLSSLFSVVGPIAQLAEQTTLNRQVLGSIPSRSTVHYLSIGKVNNDGKTSH